MPRVCGLGTREPGLRWLNICCFFSCKFYSPLKISFMCFFLLKKNRNKQSFLNLFVALTCGCFVIHLHVVPPGMSDFKKHLAP